MNDCPRIETQFIGCKPQGKLVIAPGAVREAAHAAESIGAFRVLIVSDHFMKSNGAAEEVLQALKRQHIEGVLFHGVSGEPTNSTVREAIAVGQGSDAVLGLGGGSAMDTAKLAAVCLAEGIMPENVFSLNVEALHALPLILLPTTAGTGSEVSPFAVWTAHGRKMFLTSSALYPTIALVDPCLALTLPPEVTAYTALDALTHGIEGCCGKTNLMTMTFASACARYVFHALPIAMADGNCLAARYELSCAAVMGMMAYTQGGGLYAHSISYLLPMLPHGKGCALALPATLEMNRPAIGSVLSMLDQAIGCEPGALICRLRRMIRDCGLPLSLREAGIQVEALDSLAEALLKRYPRENNPIPLTPDLARKLVAAVY